MAEGDKEMTQLYGNALREQIIANQKRTLASINERHERIFNGDTDFDDCFISVRSDAEAMDNYKMQIAILDSDGLMDYDAIIDEEGKEVNARWVSTKYGIKIVGRGVWANSKKALCKKTGWHEETIKVPAWTKFVSGSGRGMCAVYTGSYQMVRWHTNMVTGEYVGYPD